MGELQSLGEYVQSWTCSFNSLADCMLQLAYDLYVKGLFPNNVVEIEKWIQALSGLHYEFAVRSSSSGRGHLSNYVHPLDPLPSSEQIVRTRLFWQSRLQCSYYSSPLSESILFTKPDLATQRTILVSVILTIHNVDQQRNHFRLSHFLKSLADNIQRLNLHDTVELIMVDYNPDIQQPSLFKAASVVWPQLEHMPLVRIITIPKHVHLAVLNRLQSPVEALYFEYVGKNAAIRRACGDFILITTSDAWISPGFWDVVKARNLSTKHYYRVGRVESNRELPAESLAWSQSAIEDFMLKHNNGAFGVGPLKFYDNNHVSLSWLKASVHRPFETDHGNVAIIGAPGDFTLMSRQAWMYMRGHPEVPLIGMVDDFVVWLAVNIGLNAATLNAPVAMFHMYHASRKYSEAKELLDETTSAYRQGLGQGIIGWTRTFVAHEKGFVLFNDAHWGLGNFHLPEHFT
ncbi:MAG: hypothetical protein J3K34DRAFT_444580 [Monoraphidium minutum]|nr:MAG: hypothetical protein J3K34DRAFT_444580 [Monoraphidium minutum]